MNIFDGSHIFTPLIINGFVRYRKSSNASILTLRFDFSGQVDGESPHSYPTSTFPSSVLEMRSLPQPPALLAVVQIIQQRNKMMIMMIIYQIPAVNLQLAPSSG